MENKFLDIWQKKLRKEHKIAFFVTFAFVFLIHMYMFVNNLESEDAMYNYYHTQNMTMSGRWALSFFCSFSSYFHTSWINGILIAISISLTVVLLIDMFKIKNPIAIGLIGGLTSSAGFVSDITRYMYTADGYMISLLLATLAVYLTRIGEKRNKKYILGTILLCLSCGIYQSFIPYALVLVIFQTVELLIEKSVTFKECILWILKEALMFIVALASYFIIWKLCLYFCDIQAHPYMEINKVGRLNLDMIMNALTTIPFIAKKYFFGTPNPIYITPFVIINFLFVVFYLFVILYVFFKKKIFRGKLSSILYFLCFVLVIPCGSFWIFTSDSFDVWNYWPRMLGSFSLMYVYALVMYEKYCSKCLKNLFLFVAIALIINNSVLVNISYLCIEEAQNSAYASGIEMNIRIHEVVNYYKNNNPEETVSEIAFLGSNLNEALYDTHDGDKLTKYANIYPYIINLKETIVYNGEHAYKYMKGIFGIEYYQNEDMNYRNTLLKKEKIKKMGVWPADNSVAIVDNMIIVKLSEDEEV